MFEEDSDDDLEIVSQYTLTARDRAVSELLQYKRMQKLPMNDNPLNFWQNNETTLPALSTLAAKYLVVQATSVESERVFSIAGEIVSAQRSRLDPEQVDSLIFWKKNMTED